MLLSDNEHRLDAFLNACDEASSDEQLRQLFSTFPIDGAAETIADPFSKAYRGRQLDLYRAIARKPYDVANEASIFDVNAAAAHPFPFSTGSCRTAGDHFVTLGRVLGALNLTPGSRVLEFGPGWGHLTLALAALGHHVTAVDIEPRFCELITTRAARLRLAVDVVNADFSWAARVEQPYDAVVFFEAFHHADDHLSLLGALHAAVKPGGRLYLGAEPITADFPSPWGLRLDGQSLWSIRRFGWMELGFRDDYFAAALARTGWRGTRLPIPDLAVWVMEREVVPLWYGSGDARLATVTGRQHDGEIVLDAAPPGAAVFGPHVALRPGAYRGRIHFHRDGPVSGSGQIEICAENARRTIARGPFLPVKAGHPVEIAFDIDEPTWGIEVRFFNMAGFSGRIAAVEIDVRPP